MDVSSKLIAIAAVVIVVVAAIGAFALMNNDDAEEDAPSMGLLQVYGNANSDKSIDDDDLDTIQMIIDKNGDSDESNDIDWKTEYPFADADRNGKVDSADIELVKKIIGRESCEISYIDGRDVECTVSFPVERFVIAGTMVHPVINALGADGKAVGMTGKTKNLDPVLDAPSFDLPQMGSKAYTIDAELLSKAGKVDAVFTLYSSTYNEIDEGLKGTGIPSVRINSESMDKTVQAYLLVGLLTDTVEKSHAIVDFYDKYMNEISKKVESIADKKTGFAAYSYSMCGENYYMTKNIVDAGIKNLSDFSDNTKKLKDNNEWALIDKYQGDYIIEFSGWNLRWTADQNVTEEYDYYGKYFTGFDAYKEGNYVVVNKTMNDIARVAFIAAYVYPEVFGEDYGYQVYEELIQLFYPYVENFDVRTDGKWIITYDEAHPSA